MSSFENERREISLPAAQPIYRLTKPPILGRFFDALLQYFRQTNKGWKWLLSIAFCQVASAYTNIEGLRLFLPYFLAVFAGIGLQSMALYVGALYIHNRSTSERRVPAALIVIVWLSAFFSFMGFASTYELHLDATQRPMLERQDLAKQARGMAESIAIAKATVTEKLNNRISYARNQIELIHGNLSHDRYKDPDAASNMVAVERSEISSAYALQRQWRDFTFNPQTAIDQPSVSGGFAVLQNAYNQLAAYIGALSKQELGDYHLPAAPVSSVAEPLASSQQVDMAIHQLFTTTGLFVLVLALMLEAAPFAIAGLTVRHQEVELGGTLYFPELEIPARGMAERNLIRELTELNNRIRVLHFVGPNNPAEVERQVTRTEPLSEAIRQAFLDREWDQVHQIYLSHRLALRRRNLEQLIKEAQLRGVPEAELSQQIEADFNKVLEEFEQESERIAG